MLLSLFVVITLTELFTLSSGADFGARFLLKNS